MARRPFAETKIATRTSVLIFAAIILAVAAFGAAMAAVIFKPSSVEIAATQCGDSDISPYTSLSSYFEKGKTTGNFNGQNVTKEDICGSSSQLKEYSCAAGNVSESMVSCAYGCELGACKRSQMKTINGVTFTVEDVGEFPFIDGSGDKNFDLYIRPSKSVNYTYTVKIVTTSAKSNAFYLYNSSGNNSSDGKISGVLRDQSINVSKAEKWDTKFEITISSGGKTDKIEYLFPFVMLPSSFSGCSGDFCTTPSPVCNDTDLNQYTKVSSEYTSGQVTGIQNGLIAKSTDACNSTSQLKEYSCYAGRYITENTTSCVYGCELGACKRSQMKTINGVTFTVEDIGEFAYVDGSGDKQFKAFIRPSKDVSYKYSVAVATTSSRKSAIDLDYNPTGSFTANTTYPGAISGIMRDQSVNVSKIENWDTKFTVTITYGGQSGTIEYLFPFVMLPSSFNGCEGGVCATPTPICSDTDVNTYTQVSSALKKGIVTGILNNTIATNEDTCNGTSQLKEYSCYAGRYTTESTSSCTYGCSDGACKMGQTKTIGGITFTIKEQNELIFRDGGGTIPFSLTIVPSKDIRYNFKAEVTSSLPNNSVIFDDKFYQLSATSPGFSVYSTHTFNGQVRDYVSVSSIGTRTLKFKVTITYNNQTGTLEYELPLIMLPE